MTVAESDSAALQIFEHLERGPRVAAADQLNRHAASSLVPNHIGPVLDPFAARPSDSTLTAIAKEYLGAKTVVRLSDRHESPLR